jgi:hypothetical protein
VIDFVQLTLGVKQREHVNSLTNVGLKFEPREEPDSWLARLCSPLDCRGNLWNKVLRGEVVVGNSDALEFHFVTPVNKRVRRIFLLVP